MAQFLHAPFGVVEQVRTTIRGWDRVGKAGGLASMNPVLLQFVLEGPQTDSKDGSGAAAVGGDPVQGLADEFGLRFLDRGPQLEGELAWSFVRCGEDAGKVLGSDGFARAGDDQALDQISEFAHVARPGVVEKILHAFGSHLFEGLAMGSA